MPETPSEQQQRGHHARSGSARADFVANLGKKVAELRTSLRALEQDPSSARLRDDLRRRIHALSGGARLLRLTALATELLASEKLLEHAAVAGWVEPSDLRKLGELTESIPALAWNEPEEGLGEAGRQRAGAEVATQPTLPPIVLVVGAAGLADVILHPTDHGDDAEMECERVAEVEGALEMTRAIAPDVVVLDADLAGAKDLVEKLARDPLTEPVPVIAVGTWAGPDEAARWLAAGCARALPKPVSPHGLRQACLLARGGQAAMAQHFAIGSVTVEALTERVVQEVQRGLRDAVAQGQTTSVGFDDGTDVLAAVWGAVARIRDVVMIKSGGAIRFNATGPEGALPIAPWWGESSGTSKRGGGSGSSEAEMRIDGRRVVVADDDPAVTWFIGGVLRAAGAEVREARDGAHALDLCFRTNPDLVISDVLMPRLDGFALCRALKRDIALRDVPVILLSWKEDLLQRLRDLGADADGYLRKESSAGALLQRVIEVLRPRVRIEARLLREGEVRGRLDGVTPRTLLDTTSRVRPNARISIRDASFLYEVELRGGAPKSATRTTSDGSFQRGKEVFGALLGVRAGRFVVTSASGTARGTLQGSLAQQLELPISHARAAQGLLSGTKLLEVHRVDVAIDRVLPYLGATPEPVRSLVNRIANGASPRALIIAGEAASSQLEDVLADLAAHAAIVGVQGDGAVDLLGPALTASLAAGRIEAPPDDGDAVQLLVVHRHAATSPTTARYGGAAGSSPAAPADAAAGSSPAAPADAAAAGTEVAASLASASSSLIGVAFDLDDDAEASRPGEGAGASPLGGDAWTAESAGAQAPSSLAAAVMREISDRTPLPAPLPVEPTPVPSIVDTAALKSRMPPAPGHPSVSAMLAAPASTRQPQPAREPQAAPPPPSGMREPRTSSLPPDAMVPAEASEERDSRPGSSAQSRTASARATGGVNGPHPALRTVSVPSPRSRAVPLIATAGATALLLALGVYVGREPVSVPSAPSALTALTTPVPSIGRSATPLTELASASPPASPWPVAASASAAADLAPVGDDLPLPAGVPMNAAQGMLDIETGGRESIFVDGAELGRGPVLRLMLSPGVHEVRVRARAEERIRFVMIRGSRRTRLSLVSPWTR